MWALAGFLLLILDRFLGFVFYRVFIKFIGDYYEPVNWIFLCITTPISLAGFGALINSLRLAVMPDANNVVTNASENTPIFPPDANAP